VGSSPTAGYFFAYFCYIFAIFLYGFAVLTSVNIRKRDSNDPRNGGVLFGSGYGRTGETAKSVQFRTSRLYTITNHDDLIIPRSCVMDKRLKDDSERGTNFHFISETNFRLSTITTIRRPSSTRPSDRYHAPILNIFCILLAIIFHWNATLIVLLFYHLQRRVAPKFMSRLPESNGWYPHYSLF
jgi:hypothetical protein